MIEIRDYQQELIDGARADWAAGSRNVLLQLPTGGGKSPILSETVAAHVGASCTLAHRQELVSQLSMTFAKRGIAHRLIIPDKLIKNIVAEHMEEFGRSFVSPHSVAAVAGVDTVVSRTDKLKDWARQVTLWQIDEAHHVLQENKWGRAVALFQNARGLGVTATPTRTDGKGLGIHADGVFTSLRCGPITRQLINAGWLCDFELAIPTTHFDRSRLVVGSSGEFTSKSQRDEERRSQIVGDIVENYCKFAYGLQTIVFASSVEVSKEIAERFRAVGIAAEAVDANTEELQRFKTVKAFRQRQIQILVNCELFGEGFDVPGVEAVIMARPTKSLGLYLQMIGRALRPAKGKTKALIIDHVGNVMEHGLPDKPRIWTLDRRTGRGEPQPKDPDEVPLSVCPECSKVFERLFRTCPYCGFAPEISARATPEQVDGDLTLLSLDVLNELRAAANLEAPASVSERVGSATNNPIIAKRALNKQVERVQEQNELKNNIAVWAGRGRASGKSDSELYKRFYWTTGTDVLTALSGTAEQMKSIREKLEG